MTIEAGLYELMSQSEIKSPYDVDEMDFVINLEVLDGCAHHCDGCFVNRNNNIYDVDLDNALQLALDLSAKGMRFREVILSPTDIFSAENAETVLMDERFQALLQIHPKTRITTTALLDEVTDERLHAIFSILDNPDYYRDDMILEFLAPMDPARVLARDPVYIAKMKKMTDFFRTGTPKVVDWSFVINIHYDPLYWNHVDQITKYVKEDFGTIIEFLPSFFRTNKDTLIESSLRNWNELISATVTESNYMNVMLTVADKYHNSMNTIVMNYHKKGLFISPFIYEQIMVTTDFYKVDQPNADAVLAKVQDMMIQQYQYVENTESCGTCDHKETCIGRNALSFMEDRKLTKCIFPLEVIKMYHGHERVLTRRMILCANI